MEPTVEAMARLTALKTNLPNPMHVQEKYVNEFHEILGLLEDASGDDLSNFRVPAIEVHPQISSWRPMSGTVTYTQDKRCDRSFLMMKIDAVLSLFQLQASGQTSRIGFRA